MAKFVSYVDQSEENVHAAECSRGKRDARAVHSPLYPAPDNLRDLTIETYSDIWSDTYASTDEAIAAGELATYAAMVHVCPCAVKAGFKNTL